ncbi:Ferredoxin CarAc [Aquisphaera giovannonii]|uniref:Ferredoxin CarAc n=1 Tax=Aquisphaera giovannonii TaxID=406548 RepID=A0A5B9W1S2_9BACT|nr:DUF2231 domain-containing protein [Aquisphaera giovannonii]QEH34546.1 Ferredoxin CarAc [Aquisphaera giovannonii]
MRSRAHFRSHPIHPILIAFPVAFTTGALVFDLFGWLLGSAGAWSTGAYMSVAAVITGLVAGVPGFVDYVSVVPPDSSAKKRATWHMAVNLTALAIFAASWIFRDRGSLEPGAGTILLEAVGCGLIMWGGWMGGTLVYRNQIGVDHRYAGAGKWSEVWVQGAPGTAVEVANADELKPGQMKLVHAGDRRIVLVKTEDGYAACDDRCSHKGGSLAGGVAACGHVVCPWHGSTFDVRTGAVKAGPAKEPIAVHRVEEKGGKVLLTLA